MVENRLVETRCRIAGPADIETIERVPRIGVPRSAAHTK